MMSAYGAITSAFAGTVFARYMPWAAVIPSIVGFSVNLAFFIAGPRAWRNIVLPCHDFFTETISHPTS